jgi:molybdenum cofactor cytidylyltransferase
LIGIVLAAGMSSRFGECKQTYILDGKPLIRHVLDSLGQLIEVNVIVGHYENEVRSVLPGFVSKIIKNEYYKKGIGTSVQLAINYAKAKKEDLLLTLGDLVYVNREEYQRLISNYKGKTTYSSFDDSYGPPCIIPYHVLNNLPVLSEKVGLKCFIKDFDTVPIKNASKDIDFLNDIFS